MTTKGVKKESEKTSKVRELTFKCRFCAEVKPYREMVVMPRFFPPITACKSCAWKVEYAVEEEQSQEV